MKTNIFVPEKIKVGFRSRSDTYTEKLAYVIYYDEKGKLRKETSWENWRDDKINPMDLENVPTYGFVLNKKAGGYSSGWNHRQTYVRVYDPRGFEFEITIPNLLYILENTSSIKGKGLEGEFIYGWDGKDLVLLPVDSPDYKEITNLNALRFETKKFTEKNMILGATYLDKNNDHLIYLGRHFKHNYDKKETKSYFFKYIKYDDYIITFKGLTGNILDVIDEKCVSNYPDLVEILQKNGEYSERDQKKDEYVPYTLEDFTFSFGDGLNTTFFDKSQVKFRVEKDRSYYGYYGSQNKEKYYYVYQLDSRDNIVDRFKTHIKMPLKEIFTRFSPHYLVTYKSNGEKIKEWKPIVYEGRRS